MKLSLSKISFFNTISIVIVFSIVLSLFVYKFTDTFYEQKVLELEKNYYIKNKSLVKNEIERSLNKINLIKKIVYNKHSETSKDKRPDIYTTAEVNKEEIEKEIKSLFFKELKKDKFGDNKYGYFWIIGFDKIMYLHPKVEGKNISNLLTLDGKILADTIINKALNNGGYVNYKWLNPNTQNESDKISYVQKIPDTNLIIGTGFYVDELTILLKDEKEKLKKLSEEYLEKIYLTLALLIIVTLIISRYISIKIRQIEVEKDEDIHLLEQYRHLLDESSVVSRTDKNGKITYINKSFETVTGYKKKEIIGQSHSLFQHPDTPKSQFQNLWNTILAGDIWKGILKNKRKNGESYYTSITIIPIKNKNGEILRFISSAIDITKHIKNKTKLKNLFKTDSLTGLGNRVSLLNFIAKNKEVTLALINMDRFKEINDSFNHTIGDRIIKEFGARLFHHFRDKSYFLYRVQADIFAVVNNGKEDENVKDDIKDFMRTSGKNKYKVRKDNFTITYTCGIASNKDNLFAYADIALSEAKNKKLKILEYDSSLKDIDDFKNNIKWVERLNKAISDDNVVPHFQPIYNYKTGKIEKYEALMRIEEEDTLLYPNHFLDIAKKTKLYPELTYKMIEKVLNKFSLNDLEFSLNLCIEDLMNKELTTYLYDYAKKKNLCKRMVLEIVESEEMEDNEYISKVIKMFKDVGTKISIDDFGSGYSNYEYLISLQADYLKIDGSITKLIVSDNRTLDVVKSIVEFARKSDIKIIAEFVSDEEIDKILREIGIDYAQGYYYGKPQAKLL